MKVVIDTNIFVSSFFGGKPKSIIDLWAKGDLTLCISAQIMNEYIEVLLRLNIKPEYLESLIELFGRGSNIIFTNVTPEINLIKEDPSDNKFIECAVELSADFIISGDKHLLKFSRYGLIKIVTPSQFLSSL